MAELAELERAKRRRLPEVYADLRPNSKRDDDRQAKLRNLLLGAAADAGLGTTTSPKGPAGRMGAGAAGRGSGSGPSGSCAGGSPQAVQALAAAAAASIHAVSGSGAGSGSPSGQMTGALPPRRAQLRSPGLSPGLGPSGGPSSPGGAGFGATFTTAAQHNLRATSATATATPFNVTAGPRPSPHTTTTAHDGPWGVTSPGASPPGFGAQPRHGVGFGAEGGGRGAAAAAPRAPPPPGPMEGGFLHESDPIQQLSRLRAVVQGSGPGAAGAAVGLATAAAAAEDARAGAGAGAGARSASAAVVAVAGRPGGGVMHGRADAAAAAEDDDDGHEEVDVPSDVELALMSLRADLWAHPGCSDLPPLALRSQLSYMLADRSSVERQLDEQRRANRVRVFKLPTGADEFGVLTTPDYKAVVLQAADAAAAATNVSGRNSGPGTVPYSGAYGGAGGGGGTGSSPSTSRWHAAAHVFLRRVVDRFTEFQLSYDHLVHLLSTAEEVAAAGPRGGPAGGAPGGAVAQRQPGSQRDAAVTAPAKAEAVEEQISLLLHLGCIARHTDGDADAFLLAVPGAGRMVKAVLGGRKVLLTWLSKRQHHEAPEEQVCKLKLRSSCLPPLFHVRDLVGRGAVKRLESTSGPMIRLPGKPGKKPG